MGHFGVSYLEILILFERCAGHWLLSEKVTRPMYVLIALFPFPLSLFQRIEIRLGCQFIGSLVRALGKLSGGIGRFSPVGLALTCPGYDTVRKSSVRMVLLHDPWKVVTINVFRLYVQF